MERTGLSASATIRLLLEAAFEEGGVSEQLIKRTSLYEGIQLGTTAILHAFDVAYRSALAKLSANPVEPGPEAQS